MKPGNVTGDIYDRSIHKKLNSKREGIANGAAYGEDCAIFSAMHPNRACEDAVLKGAGGAAPSGELRIAAAQSQTMYTGEGCGKYAVYAAANQAAAFGVSKAAGVLLHILLPVGEGEGTLRRTVEEAQEAASDANTVIADAKAFVTPAVCGICAMATAIGLDDGRLYDVPRRAASHHPDRAGVVAGQVVMTKWAGLEGSVILASRFGEDLRGRFPSFLIEEAASFDRFLSIAQEAQIAEEAGHGALCAAAEGGIFRALWTLADRAGVGLEIDLKKIPIRQETVEICNYFDINPYGLLANGSLLCLTENAELLLRRLRSRQIPAAVIGHTMQNHDRVVINGEERRFLEPAKADEIYRVLMGREKAEA